MCIPKPLALLEIYYALKAMITPIYENYYIYVI